MESAYIACTAAQWGAPGWPGHTAYLPQGHTASTAQRPYSPTTYIEAILCPWTKRRAWAAGKLGDGRWNDVRGYGVDEIEEWLEAAPVTHSWISERLGLAPHGYRSGRSSCRAVRCTRRSRPGRAAARSSTPPPCPPRRPPRRCRPPRPRTRPRPDPGPAGRPRARGRRRAASDDAAVHVLRLGRARLGLGDQRPGYRRIDDAVLQPQVAAGQHAPRQGRVGTVGVAP